MSDFKKNAVEAEKAIDERRVEMDRAKAVTERLATPDDVLQRDHEARIASMKMETEELKARTERLILMNAKQKYQAEIHGVALNVLVGVLTKDALRSIKDSEFSTTAVKINVAEVVDYSLIVGKRFIDELHKIGVSEKQIAEYKDSLGPLPLLPSEPESIITPPPGSSST
jgi:hypothetical protein